MEIIAHRGASGYALENSREALELAWRLGADRVEIDVRASRDGKLIVLHDPSLNRTTTGQGQISQLCWEELKDVRLRNGEPLLTFDEALDLLRGRATFYVEIKDPQVVKGVAHSLKGIEEEAIVGSANAEVLRRIRQFNPRVATSLLVRDVDEQVALSATAQGVDFVHPCWERFSDPLKFITPTFLRRVHEAGLRLILWHEERPRVLRQIATIKEVYGVCTNTPDRARRILKPALPNGRELRSLASGRENA